MAKNEIIDKTQADNSAGTSDSPQPKKKFGVIKIILLLILGFFLIVLIYFLYRFFTGLAHATINGIHSLFVYAAQLADDMVKMLIEGIKAPFRFVDDIIEWMFG